MWLRTRSSWTPILISEEKEEWGWGPVKGANPFSECLPTRLIFSLMVEEAKFLGALVDLKQCVKYNPMCCYQNTQEC